MKTKKPVLRLILTGLFRGMGFLYGGHERIHKIINRDDKDALRRDWEVIEIDLQKAIDRYNKSPLVRQS